MIINVLKSYFKNTVKTALIFVSRFRTLVSTEVITAVSKLITFTEKLFRAKQQLRFLLRCRKQNIFPNFIEFSVNRISKLFIHEGIKTASKRFKKCLLNIAIQDTFSRINHYEKSLDTAHKTEISDDYLKNFTISVVKIIEDGITTYMSKKLKSKFSKIQLNHSKLKSVNNSQIESIFVPENRVTIIDKDICLTKPQLSVLSRGPNFVPAPKITQNVILDAEIGMEKLAYHIRWNDKHETPTNKSYFCGTCNELVDSESSIFCDGDCKSWFHLNCTKISSNDFIAHTRNPEKQWLCENCGVDNVNVDDDTCYSDNDRCGDYVRNSDKGIQCEGQQHSRPTWFHIHCVKMSNSQYKQLTSSEIKWYCNTCSLSIPKNCLMSSKSDSDVTDFIPTFSKDNTIFPSAMPFKDIRKYQPPQLRVSKAEDNLKSLKFAIKHIYSQSMDRNVNHNLSQNERSALKSLQESRKENTIFKMSDKGKGFVVMKKETYESKCMEHLNDINTYEPLSAGPLSGSKTRVKNCISTLEGKLPSSTLDTLKPNHTHLAEFYALIKTHKEALPPRPIISAIDSPPEKLSFIITQIITQCQTIISKHTIVKDSYDFLDRLHLKFPEEIPHSAILFSLDISSMYTNIPIDDCKLKLLNFISSNGNEIKTFGLSYPDIEVMLHTVMHESYFRFGDKMFHQKRGLGMGHRYSPPAANVYVFALECDIIKEWNEKYPDLFIDITKWFRALDDIFSIWLHGIDSLLLFLDYINNFHPTIKFTLEHSLDSINFLDVTISKNPLNDSKLTTELFIKPTHSGVSLNYYSKHPRHVILNTAKNHFRRAFLLSNTEESRSRSFERIKQLLSANNFPPHIIKQQAVQVMSSVHTTNNRNQGKNTDKQFTLILPYINDSILNDCKQALKNSGMPNIKIASKPQSNLKNRLVQTPFSPRPCHKTCSSCSTAETSNACKSRLVIYQLTFSTCGESYIGQNSCELHERLYQHLYSIRKQEDDLTISTHFNEEHPEITINERKFSSKILRKCSDYVSMMIAEALLINKLKPKLNIYSGKWRIL